MPVVHASVSWSRRGEAFVDNRYSRAHQWRFDGGAEVAASSSPAVVPEPFSDPAAVDPEEAFVASVSSCHMLWFLSLAARAGWVVDAYEDDAEAVLARGGDGRQAVTRVELRPAVRYAGAGPDTVTEAGLHEAAHAACFIAASVRSEITVVPRPPEPVRP